MTYNPCLIKRLDNVLEYETQNQERCTPEWFNGYVQAKRDAQREIKEYIGEILDRAYFCDDTDSWVIFENELRELILGE